MFLAYYPLFLLITGTIWNLFTFIILCRAPFRDVKKQPAMHYMRAIAIFDILMLYGWNLDHFLFLAYNFKLIFLTIPSCKYMAFISYFAPQISAWLRVFIGLDRCLFFNRISRTWFGTSKSIIIIISIIVGIFFLFNCHLLIFACYYTKSGEINPDARQYSIYPLWDNIHLYVYNCVPCILMFILTLTVIYRLHRTRRVITVTQHNRSLNRSVSITLIATTCLFVVMTLPSCIIFAFFSEVVSDSVLIIVDHIYFTYHILSFPLYMITFTDFRRECIAIIRCRKIIDRIRTINRINIA